MADILVVIDFSVCRLHFLLANNACRSERVSKTGVNGLLLTEAKYINLSLHYLEQVIARAVSGRFYCLNTGWSDVTVICNL